MKTCSPRAWVTLLVVCVAACSSGGEKQAIPTTARVSTTTTARSSCPFQGAVVVNLGGSGHVGNNSQPERTITVGQNLWVTDRPAPPTPGAPTGPSVPVSDYLTYPHTTSNSLRVICHVGTDAFVDTLFRANAPGTATVISDTKCAGCNQLGFGAKVTVVSQSRVAAINLGPCPKRYPITPLTKLNAGVAGLDKKLVPILALRMRVCTYAGNGQPVDRPGLTGSAATTIENGANALPTDQRTALNQTPTGPCGAGPLFVTFVNRAQQVSLTVTGCDAVTNGVFLAFGTATWLNEIRGYTDFNAINPPIPLPTGQASGVPTGPP